MNKFSFIEPLLRYVEKKAQSFLESHGLVDSYEDILKHAKEVLPSVVDYINIILNETVSIVAKEEEKDWNDVKDEFCCHYLKD